jgi:hypothetical protein
LQPIENKLFKNIKMKTVLQISLFIVAVVLAYFIYKSIQEPIQFEKAKKARYDATVEKLKDIRKAELAYKGVYGKFTGSWDTLLNFIMNESVITVRKVGELNDSMVEQGITERKALEMGLIIRDSVRVPALEAVFGKGYDAKSLKYVPVPGEPTEFNLGATIIITGSGIGVPVFQAKAHNNVILRGLEQQLVINLNDQRRTNEKYPGLMVGSLTETVNNAGNWE